MIEGEWNIENAVELTEEAGFGLIITSYTITNLDTRVWL
jgi:hypothetical protein